MHVDFINFFRIQVNISSSRYDWSGSRAFWEWSCCWFFLAVGGPEYGLITLFSLGVLITFPIFSWWMKRQIWPTLKWSILLHYVSLWIRWWVRSISIYSHLWQEFHSDQWQNYQLLFWQEVLSGFFVIFKGIEWLNSVSLMRFCCHLLNSVIFFMKSRWIKSL